MKLSHNSQDIDLIRYVGRQIALLRRQKNMSQEDLAYKLGISNRQLSKYEIGKNRITVDRLFVISKILNVDVEKFLPDFSSKNETNFNKDKIILDNFSNYKKISREEFLLKLADLIID